MLIATIRVEVAAGLEPAMLGNLLHLPCNTGLVRFTMMPSFHNIVTKSTKSCQRLPIPPYYQICVLSTLSDCLQYQLNARNRTLSLTLHNLNQRAEFNGIRAETGNRTPLFGWNVNALPMSYFRKCLSIPSCQHYEPPCRHRQLPHDFVGIHLDRYSLGLISDLPFQFLSATLSAFLSSDRPDTRLQFG